MTGGKWPLWGFFTLDQVLQNHLSPLELFVISMFICWSSQLFFFFSAGADSPRSSTEPIPLAVAKEAKVSDMEDDKLEDEDFVFLEE